MVNRKSTISFSFICNASHRFFWLNLFAGWLYKLWRICCYDENRNRLEEGISAVFKGKIQEFEPESDERWFSAASRQYQWSSHCRLSPKFLIIATLVCSCWVFLSFIIGTPDIYSIKSCKKNTSFQFEHKVIGPCWTKNELDFFTCICSGLNEACIIIYRLA